MDFFNDSVAARSNAADARHDPNEARRKVDLAERAANPPGSAFRPPAQRQPVAAHSTGCLGRSIDIGQPRAVGCRGPLLWLTGVPPVNQSAPSSNPSAFFAGPVSSAHRVTAAPVPDVVAS